MQIELDLSGKASDWFGVRMKKAVMYGAGNIGRGLIGKTFSESGYEVCFVDVDVDIIAKINKDRCYPVKIVYNDNKREEIVKNVRAVNGNDIDCVAQEIASADIIATAVGVSILPRIIMPICAGLKKRLKENGRPLNIIICENMIDADKYLRGLIEREMGDEYKEIFDTWLGLVKASIGRMVPIMTDEMREGNILKVWVEAYDELPVDKAAFVGEIPQINNMLPFSPFGFYIKRKLFIHNMGHTMSAYLGWQKGYKYIYECIADKDIRTFVNAAMKETAKALSREYAAPLEGLEIYIEDLLSRFYNKALEDTTARVGRDPKRKLGCNDRLVGAALYCVAQKVEPANITKGIVAGLRYNNSNDEAAVKMQKYIKREEIEAVIQRYCGIEKSSALFESIINQYQNE